MDFVYSLSVKKEIIKKERCDMKEKIEKIVVSWRANRCEQSIFFDTIEDAQRWIENNDLDPNEFLISRQFK